VLGAGGGTRTPNLLFTRQLGTVQRVLRRAVLAAYGCSPIDLLPEFLPVIGPLDDVVVLALALRYAARQVPREVLAAAWPGAPRSWSGCWAASATG
jgi:uncharacterized membrane protein YkvA (DUF1232 family)